MLFFPFFPHSKFRTSKQKRCFVRQSGSYNTFISTSTPLGNSSFINASMVLGEEL